MADLDARLNVFGARAAMTVMSVMLTLQVLRHRSLIARMKSAFPELMFMSKPT